MTTTTPTTSTRERGFAVPPILIPALLDGSKTQHRWVVKPKPPEGIAPIKVGDYSPIVVDRHGMQVPGETKFGAYDMDGEWCARCPIGNVGDTIWLKERWNDFCPIWDGAWCGCGSVETQAETHKVAYSAGSVGIDHQEHKNVLPLKWKPSAQMPRWASRYSAIITNVKVERLVDISEEDAMAEGCDGDCPVGYIPAYKAGPYSYHFAKIWESANGKRPGCSWSDSPWVWAMTFERAIA